MKKKLLLLVPILVFLFSGILLAQDTFFWKISGNGCKKSSYLFGTYHLLNDEYLQKYPKVLKQFEKAQAVLVESEIDSARLLQLSMKAMMMDDETLPNLMSLEQHEMLLKEVSAVLPGAPALAVNRFKPSALLTILSLHYTRLALPELDQYSGIPMDGFFTQVAHANGKKVIGLENAEETLQLAFDYTSLQEQANQLVKFLDRDKDVILKEHRLIADTYLDPNFDKMEAVNQTYFLEYGEEYMTSLLNNRNTSWMPAIEASIKSDPSFIAVGAAHLVGEDGLIELLRQQGYKVEPVH